MDGIDEALASLFQTLTIQAQAGDLNIINTILSYPEYVIIIHSEVFENATLLEVVVSALKGFCDSEVWEEGLFENYLMIIEWLIEQGAIFLSQIFGFVRCLGDVMSIVNVERGLRVLERIDTVLGFQFTEDDFDCYFLSDYAIEYDRWFMGKVVEEVDAIRLLSISYSRTLEKLDLLLELGYNPLCEGDTNIALFNFMDRDMTDLFTRLIELPIQQVPHSHLPDTKNIDIYIDSFRGSWTILGLACIHVEKSVSNSRLPFLEKCLENCDLSKSFRPDCDLHLLYYTVHFLTAHSNRVLDALEQSDLLLSQINQNCAVMYNKITGTPLFISLYLKKYDLALRLIEKGADPNIIIRVFSSKRLLKCARIQSDNIEQYEYEISPLIYLPDDIEYLRKIENYYRIDVDRIFTIEEGMISKLYTPLLVAFQEDFPIKRILFDYCSNINIQDHHGATIMHYDAISSSSFIKEHSDITTNKGYTVEELQCQFRRISYSKRKKVPGKTVLIYERAAYPLRFHIYNDIFYLLYSYLISKRDILTLSQVCYDWRTSMNDVFWKLKVCHSHYNVEPDISIYALAMNRYSRYLDSFTENDKIRPSLQLPKWLFIADQYNKYCHYTYEYKTRWNMIHRAVPSESDHPAIFSHSYITDKIRNLTVRLMSKIISFYPFLSAMILQSKTQIPSRNDLFVDENTSYFCIGDMRKGNDEPTSVLEFTLTSSENIELFHNPHLRKFFTKSELLDQFGSTPEYVVIQCYTHSLLLHVDSLLISDILTSQRAPQKLDIALASYLLSTTSDFSYTTKLEPGDTYSTKWGSYTYDSRIPLLEKKSSLLEKLSRRFCEKLDKNTKELFKQILDGEKKKSKTLEVSVIRFVLRYLQRIFIAEADLLQNIKSWELYPDLWKTMKELSFVVSDIPNDEKYNPFAWTRLVHFTMNNICPNTIFSNDLFREGFYGHIPVCWDDYHLGKIDKPKELPYYLIRISIFVIEEIFQFITLLYDDKFNQIDKEEIALFLNKKSNYISTLYLPQSFNELKRESFNEIQIFFNSHF